MRRSLYINNNQGSPSEFFFFLNGNLIEKSTAILRVTMHHMGISHLVWCAYYAAVNLFLLQDYYSVYSKYYLVPQDIEHYLPRVGVIWMLFFL